MKQLLAVLFLLSCFLKLHSQEGPGGVGSSSNNVLWLDASTLNLNNSDPISSWTDVSGNNNHAEQSTPSNQPTFSTSQINSLPSVNFSGSGTYLELLSNEPASAISTFVVYKRSTSAGSSFLGIANFEKHYLFSSSGFFVSIYSGSSTRHSISKTNNQFSISSLHTSSNVASGSLSLRNGSSSVTPTRAALHSAPKSIIGARSKSDGSVGLNFKGDIAEFIVYNTQLNSASRKIIGEYLSSKYNLTSEASIYSYSSTHSFDLKGIGQESDGSNTIARGNDSLEISNASSLSNGDYILIGSDGNDYTTTTSTPNYITERWNRTWKADVTGTPGSVDISFYMGSNGFASAGDYRILADSVDNDFTNGDTYVLAANPVDNGNSISFSGVTFTDGHTFTLAEVTSVPVSITHGDWNSTDTWNCACIPGETDNVIIASPHTVTIDANSSALAFVLQNGATLEFSGNDTLFIYEDATFAGTVNAGTGTIAAVKTTDSQLFYNNSGNEIILHNLYVNNNSNLDIENGTWGISNNLQVVSGGLDVRDATNFTMYSGSGGTSQILESMNSAFRGAFNIQRYISGRRTDYANFSSPISNGTISDWDDDFYLSGVNGEDDNILMGGGGTFFSVFTYDSPNDVHSEVTSTATALTPGVGFEIYLTPNAKYFVNDTFDVRGRPNNGAVTVQVDQGWNLVGNPYHSFIDYDELTSTGLATNYYIFNTVNGTYSSFNGATHIPPSQGFWVEKSSVGTVNLTFNEDDKVNSNATTFYREKESKNALTLTLTNDVNPYKHKMSIQLDGSANNLLDEQDASFLASPIEEAPAIYSKIESIEKSLVINTLNSWNENHQVPVEIYAGENGNYTISTNQLNDVINAYNCVYLFDKETNNQIDLSVESEYQFFTEKGKHNRFNLFLSNSIEYCQPTVQSSTAFIQEIEDRTFDLRNSNGNWYLDYSFDELNTNQVEVKVLNINGQEVSSPTTLNLSGSGSQLLKGIEELNGIYLIQIISQDKFINKTVKL